MVWLLVGCRALDRQRTTMSCVKQPLATQSDYEEVLPRGGRADADMRRIAAHLPAFVVAAGARRACHSVASLPFQSLRRDHVHRRGRRPPDRYRISPLWIFHRSTRICRPHSPLRIDVIVSRTATPRRYHGPMPNSTDGGPPAHHAEAGRRRRVARRTLPLRWRPCLQARLFGCVAVLLYQEIWSGR